jgi:trimeric autotransporter adhesin
MKLATLPAMLAICSLTACGGSTSPDQLGGDGLSTTASVQVTPASLTLKVGETQQFAAVPLTSAGTPRSGRTTAWSSSAPGVATVVGTGQVVAIAAGTALISATIDNVSAGALVTVIDPPPAAVASVAIVPTSASLDVGEIRTLATTMIDVTGRLVTGRATSWTSSAPSVATVSQGGVVTAVAPGTAFVSVASEGKSATATIVVRDLTPVASVALSPTLATVDIGVSMGISVTLRDNVGTVLQNRRVDWSSSEPAVASVSAGGVVTGLAVGKSTITATSEGKSSVVIVTVRAP